MVWSYQGRNAQHRNDAIKSGSVTPIFNSLPVEFRSHSAALEVNGQYQELPNDFAWIFAGGVAPNEFLKKIDVRFGSKDLTAEASREAREASSPGTML
jgi:hypothetical protein